MVGRTERKRGERKEERNMGNKKTKDIREAEREKEKRAEKEIGKGNERGERSRER